MIEFLVMQILLGNIALAQIPEKFKDTVRQKLTEIGGGDVIDQT